jgi:hypothetical protein
MRKTDAKSSSPGDDAVDPKVRDADGKQLAQRTKPLFDELREWRELAQEPNLDLDLASTERRRATRSRTLRKR